MEGGRRRARRRPALTIAGLTYLPTRQLRHCELKTGAGQRLNLPRASILLSIRARFLLGRVVKKILHFGRRIEQLFVL